MNKNVILPSLCKRLLLIAFCISTEISCRQFDLQEKHASLSAAQPFAYFDLNESQEDIQLLQSLVIENVIDPNKPMVLNYYGDLTQLQQKIIEFLLSCGNSQTDSCRAAEIIHRIATNCLDALNAQEAWIAIRAFKQNSLYDIARWHIDSERLYTIKSGFLYKVACALKGAGTLLCNVPKDARKEYLAIKTKKYTLSQDQHKQKIRLEVAELLQKYRIESAQPGQGIVFIMGSEEIGAIHSEPKIDHDRIFMSIIPGTHEQIQELYRNWRRSIENRF